MGDVKINVSIIIPTKNEENRLPQCLISINQLEYDKHLLEIIVVDNGSKDNTVQVAREYGCTVINKPMATVAGLRNAGAKHAKGKFLAFLDADMIVSPQWLMNAIFHLEDTKIACITGLLDIPTQHAWLEEVWTLNRKTENKVYQVRWAPSGNMIVRSEAFRQVNGFSDHLVSGEDVDFCEKLRNLGYAILYDRDVRVVHTGEYKTVLEFFKKERWRGYGDLDLLLRKPFQLRNLRHGTQPIYFLLSWICLFIFIIIYKFRMVIFSCLAILSLPFLRSIMVLYKVRQAKYIFPLLFIWSIYYCARGWAILDNMYSKVVGIIR
jgi:glycosyltransferase involved in cell wall biosynthesis